MRCLLRLLAPALALAACATPRGAGPAQVQVAGAIAAMPECGVFAGRPTYSLDLGETTERQVLGLTCYETYVRAPDAAKRAYVQLHAQFDDRHFDSLSAALMVVACAGDGACRAHSEPESLGQMAYYAKNLSASAVERSLKLKPLTNAVVRAFLSRVAAARETVLREAGELDARRAKIYLEVPARLHARQEAHWKAFATFYARLDDLLPRVDPALRDGATEKQLRELVADTTKLRDDYLARCAARNARTPTECLTGPIGRPLTQRLVQLAIRLNDPVLAQAEYALLRLGPDRSTAALEITTAQTKAVEDEQAQHERWLEEKDEGVDDATLAAAYGTPPPALVPALAWRAPRDLAGYRYELRRLESAVEFVRGTVRFVRPRGDEMEVYFEKEEVTNSDCTGLQPERMSNDFSECTPDETRTVPISRVFLAIRDAKPILIGNRLEAVIARETRRGLPVQVFKSRKAEELVQVRAVRWRQ